MRIFFWLFLILAMLPAKGLQAQERRHIRVILDTSISMKTFDQKRFAPLATAMLHDLARPDLASGDTFEVIPFVSGGGAWSDSTRPCEDRVGKILSPPRGVPPATASADLARQLGDTVYDSNKTYFYPVLCAAVKSLEGQEGERVIVLITDGLSDRPDEQQMILDDLSARMSDGSMKLYVLAFGPETTRAAGFFQPIVHFRGESLGQILENKEGDRLLENMIEIFGQCFGYVSNTVSGREALLRENVVPENVAVVAFWKQSATPGFEVKTSEPLGRGNPPQRIQQPNSAYALRWLTTPIPEKPVQIELTTPGATIAVLRPPEIELIVLDKDIHLAVATKAELCLTVATRLKGGAKEPPPADLTLSFQIIGPEYVDGWFGAAGGALNADGDAREYQVCPAFKDTFTGGVDYYRGRIQVRAMRGEAVVANLTSGVRGYPGFPAQVHPALRLEPNPSFADADKGNMSRSDVGCARFNLDLLPFQSFRSKAATDNPYTLVAVLDPSVTLDDGPLKGSVARIEGRPVKAKGAAGSRWRLDLTESMLQKIEEAKQRGQAPFEACVEIGRPSAGGKAEMKVQFLLEESPYNDLPLASMTLPFTLNATVAEPDWRQRYWSLFTLIGLFLLLMLLAWYLRYRDNMPEDFRVAWAAGGPGTPYEPSPLSEAPLFARLAGLKADLPIEASGTHGALAWVRPLGDDLYQVRTPAGAKSIQEERAGDWENVSSEDGRGYFIEARRNYRFETADGQSKRFRVEFRR